MWDVSPLIALTIFGLPVVVFTFLVVMLCCLEPASENEEFEEDMEQTGVQRDEKDISGLAEESKPTRLKSE